MTISFLHPSSGTKIITYTVVAQVKVTKPYVDDATRIHFR